MTVVSRDRPGIFARIAGMLALQGLDVLEANAASEGDVGVSAFKVVRSTGEPPVWDKVITDVEAAMDGRIAVISRRPLAPVLSERPNEPTLTRCG